MEILLKNSDQGVWDAYDKYIRFNQSEELRMLEEAREKALLDYNSHMLDARCEERAKTLLQILTKRFQSVPESLESRIFAITDLAKLEELTDFALDCESLETFSEELTK